MFLVIQNDTINLNDISRISKEAPRLRFKMVGLERLELAHLAAPEPKSGASTNFATAPLIKAKVKAIKNPNEWVLIFG